MQDFTSNKTDYVDLGLACVEVCEALTRAMRGKKEDDLSPFMIKAVGLLATWVKPVTHSLDASPTMFLIAEPWRGSKIRSPKRVNGRQSFDLFMRALIRRRSPVGSRSSVIVFSALTCVQPLLLGRH
jgi:hypothetical protein